MKVVPPWVLSRRPNPPSVRQSSFPGLHSKADERDTLLESRSWGEATVEVQVGVAMAGKTSALGGPYLIRISKLNSVVSPNLHDVFAAGMMTEDALSTVGRRSICIAWATTQHRSDMGRSLVASRSSPLFGRR